MPAAEPPSAVPGAEPPNAVPGGEPLICSARGCRAPARWSLRWNNPRLHTADRRKTWLACDEHRASLGEFLDRRGFLRAVEPVPQAPRLDT